MMYSEQLKYIRIMKILPDLAFKTYLSFFLFEPILVPIGSLPIWVMFLPSFIDFFEEVFLSFSYWLFSLPLNFL